MPLEPLMTIEEVAAYLRTPVQSLYSQRKRGVKPGALGMRVGKKLLWDPQELQNWIMNERERQRRE